MTEKARALPNRGGLARKPKRVLDACLLVIVVHWNGNVKPSVFALGGMLCSWAIFVALVRTLRLADRAHSPKR